MRSRAVWLGLLGLAVPALAAAHPGHGVPGSGASTLHYLTEPAHLGGAILVVLVSLIAAALWLSPRAR